MPCESFPLATLKERSELSIWRNGAAAKTKAGRSALPVSLRAEPTLRSRDLFREFATVLRRDRTLHMLDERPNDPLLLGARLQRRRFEFAASAMPDLFAPPPDTSSLDG